MGSRGDGEGNRDHGDGSEEAADVRADERVAGELADPSDEHDEEQPAKRPTSCREVERRRNAEKQYAQPRRPPAEQVPVAAAAELAFESAGYLCPSDNSKREQQQLERTDEPARAGDHPARTPAQRWPW
jgi:hypothetical protein